MPEFAKEAACERADDAWSYPASLGGLKPMRYRRAEF